MAADPQASGIFAAMADFRPAIIRPGITRWTQDVDLVPTARPMLMTPNFAGSRIHRQSLRIAVPDGEVLWRPTRLSFVSEMRIAWVGVAVQLQADDAGGMC